MAAGIFQLIACGLQDYMSYDNSYNPNSFTNLINGMEDCYDDDIFKDLIYDKLEHEQAYIRWLIHEKMKQTCGMKFKQLPSLVFQFLPPFRKPKLYHDWCGDKLDVYHKLMEFYFPRTKWESDYVYRTRIFKQNYKFVEPYVRRYTNSKVPTKKKRRRLFAAITLYYTSTSKQQRLLGKKFNKEFKCVLND